MTLDVGDKSAPLLAALRSLNVRVPPTIEPGLTLTPALRAAVEAIA